MSDLIRREDAIEAVENNSYGMGSRASVKAIKALPSAEARPRGEWTVEAKQTIYGQAYILTCSECGERFSVTEAALPEEKYCRHCGADMRKGARR